ncbi:long-chain fatty acid--CoA ligase [Priestia megaterium]|nr:long-chain fatty acid--CoA ligase [Priestia megaterium]
MHDLMNRPWYQFYVSKTELQVPEVSLYALLGEAARQYADRTAVIYKQTELTYRELKDQVDRLAAAWEEIGLQQGKRIGLMLGNHPDYIISYYAAQALGLIVVQINPLYTPRELLQIVSDSEVSYLVADATALKTVRGVSELYLFEHIFAANMGADENHSLVSLAELKKYPHHLRKPAFVSVHNDVAVIQYTGGTTGKMKGAMLTHYGLVANVIQSYVMYGDRMLLGQEVILTAIPLYHVYAMTSAMNLGIYIGGTILLLSKFEVNDVLENIKKYQPTFFPGVPKMYNAFVNHPEVERYGLDCLKLCSSGSAPLPIEVLNRFEQLTGAMISEGFGMSEASPTTHRNPSLKGRKVGSIGIPMPGTDCRIVDENGQELPPKCVGEMIIKGPQIMKGYWNNEEETYHSLQNGWLFTGDLATMDEQGYFYIVGRKKEMVIVGGFNIYPQEVESVLYEHPHVKEAAVVGVPDEANGEVVKAYVVPKDGCDIDLEELKGHCYLKLTRYKVPKQYEIRDSLPRNTVGKLLKRLLIQEEKEKGERKSAN